MKKFGKKKEFKGKNKEQIEDVADILWAILNDIYFSEEEIEAMYTAIDCVNEIAENMK